MLYLQDECLNVTFDLQPGYNTVPVVVPLHTSDGVTEWVFCGVRKVYIVDVNPQMVGPPKHLRQVCEHSLSRYNVLAVPGSNFSAAAHFLGFESVSHISNSVTPSDFSVYSYKSEHIFFNILKLFSPFRLGRFIYSFNCIDSRFSVIQICFYLIVLYKWFDVKSARVCVPIELEDGFTYLFFWDLEKFVPLDSYLFFIELETVRFCINRILNSKGIKLDVTQEIMCGSKPCGFFLFVDIAPRPGDYYDYLSGRIN